YYGMKSFFARTFETGGRLGERDLGVVKYIPNKGKEKVAPVMFLTGKVIDAPGMQEAPPQPKKKRGEKAGSIPPPPKYSLQAKLGELALEPDQGDFFTRSVVNRVWDRFFGRGLVMPLDQMHSANPPSHPELLQWLARDLVSHNYDLRRLIRGLVMSQAYARTSRWDNENVPQEKLFAVAQVRPLSPTQLALSLRLAATDAQALPAAGPGLDKKVDE